MNANNKITAATILNQFIEDKYSFAESMIKITQIVVIFVIAFLGFGGEFPKALKNIFVSNISDENRIKLLILIAVAYGLTHFSLLIMNNSASFIKAESLLVANNIKNDTSALNRHIKQFLAFNIVFLIVSMLLLPLAVGVLILGNIAIIMCISILYLIVSMIAVYYLKPDEKILLDELTLINDINKQ